MQHRRGCGATCRHGGGKAGLPGNLVQMPCFRGRHFFALPSAQSQGQPKFLVSEQPKFGTSNPAIVSAQEGWPAGRRGCVQHPLAMDPRAVSPAGMELDVMLRLQPGFCLPLLIHRCQKKAHRHPQPCVSPDQPVRWGSQSPAGLSCFGALRGCCPPGMSPAWDGAPMAEAPKSPTSRAGARPTPCSPQGDAQVSPSGGCAPKRYSLLPN